MIGCGIDSCERMDVKRIPKKIYKPQSQARRLRGRSRMRFADTVRENIKQPGEKVLEKFRSPTRPINVTTWDWHKRVCGFE